MKGREIGQMTGKEMGRKNKKGIAKGEKNDSMDGVASEQR